MKPSKGPLEGLSILDLATVVAGPWAATLLADLGADVVKVELPAASDALRSLPPHKDDVPLWWKVGNRNKRGITLDVRTAEGKAVLLRMLSRVDVLVENFRTGTLDRWGLDKETLWRANPKLTILRVTGFGQTGPYRNRPGFARIFEAMSGFTYLNGMPDGPPLNMGFPLSDSIAGLFGALGILSAVYHRLKHPDAPGQEIDVSATEAIFRTIDFLAVEFDQLGTVRERQGNLSAYSAPSNIYRTRDGKWLSIAISAQSVFERFASAMQMPELLGDERFSTNQVRVKHRDALDRIVSTWIGNRNLPDLASILTEGEISFSPIYSIKEVFEDPHFREREMIITVADSRLGPMRMQNVVPRFSDTPGGVRMTGPEPGEHNEAVYREMGLTADELQALRTKHVI